MKIFYNIIVSCFLLMSFSLRAADINTTALKVQAIKVDYGADSNNNLYYYLFSGGSYYPGGCGGTQYARSGDSNVNTLLLMAYKKDMTVKIGVDPAHACVITTVVVDKNYQTSQLY
ncbi:TPA: hypothetical protein HNO24_25310 [Escherichia coli]|nr:hypothetical protein [Escherichia coli]HAJ7165346.1 hypothetical protein [Escherichia coli]HAJ7170495.1 hypothetical protein [Escherichia coli]HAJ7199812.1 hypothetical protein [Escherichia coli]